jgi:hypothetical protein
VKRLPIILAIFVLTLALPFSASARQDLSGVYEVEMVVFQNNLPDLEGGEIWSQDRVNTDIKDLDKAITVNDQPDPNSDLTQALQKLDGDDSYQILFHKRWVEEAKPEDDADLIRINNDDGSLDGTMKFYLSRFLHIDVNLLLKQVPPVADLQSDLAPPTMYYRISEERRVGPDEMQYFDHPKFGAIISIKPVLSDTK